MPYRLNPERVPRFLTSGTTTSTSLEGAVARVVFTEINHILTPLLAAFGALLRHYPIVVSDAEYERMGGIAQDLFIPVRVVASLGVTGGVVYRMDDGSGRMVTIAAPFGALADQASVNPPAEPGEPFTTSRMEVRVTERHRQSPGVVGQGPRHTTAINSETEPEDL